MNSSDRQETVTPQEAEDRLNWINEQYDREGRRNFGEERDTEMCDLCTVVEADGYEFVQAEGSGRMMEVALCDPCSEKTERYEAGEDVDFGEELRLHDR